MKYVKVVGLAVLGIVGALCLASANGGAQERDKKQSQKEQVKEYLEKHHEGHQAPEEIKNGSFAKWLKGYGLFVARTEKGGCEACQNTGRIVCVVNSKGEVTELKDEKAVVELFKTVKLKASSEDEVKDLTYVAMVLVRLQHPKAHTKGLLPGKNASNDNENILNKGDYQVQKKDGWAILDLNLQISHEYYTSSVHFDKDGQMDKIELTCTGMC